MEWRNLHSRELGLLTKCRGGDLPEFLARKLEISTVLNGHTGCVNRLAWNQDGSLLASASDDCQVLLWHYPDTSRVPIALETEHRANLFGVAILPFSNNCKIVSGAMDYTVQLHELGEGAFNITPKYRSSLNSTRGSSGNGAPPPMRRHPPSPQVHVVKPRTTIFHCHKSRVKEVEVCLAEPSLFWSAGEDGVVRQYDARTPDQKAYGSANVLVNLMTAGPSGGLVECKGLSVNQQNPNLMGVACGDPYVRLFDRRKLSTCRPGGGPTSALLQLTAPHLPLELAAGMIRRCHATHCSFSHKGDRLVASFHGDHAYIFYVTGAAGQHTQQLSPQQQQRQQQRVRRRLQQEHDFADLSPSASPKQQKQQQLPTQQQQQQQQHQGQPVSQAGNGSSMPEAADAARVSGNNALFEQSYTAAIGHFTAAIAAAPQAAGLYTQRALALLKRGWEGDASFALRDCETAVQLVLQQQQQQQQGDGSSSLSGHRESSGGGSSSNGGSNGSSSVEQQARLRLVHALKQLGQVKCALAALDSYKELYPAAASSSDVATLEKFLQEHLQRRLAYKRKVATNTARLRRTRQETAAAAGTGFAARRQQQQAQEQRQQQQQVVGASIPPAPPAPPAQQQQGSDAQQQQQQEQEQQQQQPSAAAMSRSVSSGGSSSGGSSRSASPLGGRPPDPPGRGIRVDTDVDSEDLERDTEMQTTSAAAAAAAAAAAGASEVMSAAAAAAAAAAESAEGYLHSFIGPVLPEGFSTAAAAAVATQPPPPPPPRPAAAAAAPEGMVVESWSGSAGDESSPGSDPMSEGDDDSQAAGLRSSPQPLLVDPELPAEPITEDELLEDELLAPWYGPAVFCRPGPHARPGASVRTGKEAHMQQQQQQQPLSGGGSGGSSSSSGSRRRRPRSNSGDDIDAADSDDEDAMLTPARRQAGDGSRWRSGQQQQQQQQWWDVFCGGQGRLLQRCIGQCNVQTDIKEAVFLGQDDALVACGSDDGYVFIYNSHTGNPVKVLAADEDVANCVQPHPHLPVLATSGIDTVVRLWAPTGVADMGSCERYVTENQARMRDGARPLRAGMVPPHILQAALGDNPQLLQMLLQQLYRPTTPAAGGAAAAAGGGAAAGARGGPASEGTPEAGRQGLGPVPGIEIVGLGAEEDDEDESDDESGEEGFGVNDEDEDEGLEGHGEEGGVGRARRRRPPRRQVQEVTCRMS